MKSTRGTPTVAQKGASEPVERSEGKRSESAHHSYKAAVTASLGAEVAFMALMMSLARAQGKDPWHITRVPASLVMGPAATHPKGFDALDVARGLGMHAVLSVITGVGYAELLKRSRLSPVTGGLIVGEALYTLGTYIGPNVLPRHLAPMRKSMKERIVTAGTHALYGLAFGLLYRAFKKNRERS